MSVGPAGERDGVDDLRGRRIDAYQCLSVEVAYPDAAGAVRNAAHSAADRNRVDQTIGLDVDDADRVRRHFAQRFRRRVRTSDEERSDDRTGDDHGCGEGDRQQTGPVAPPRCGGLCPLELERRLLREDLALEPFQRGAGLETELLGKEAPCVVVVAQRFRLPP
jgi:hypothetical protein